MDLLAKYKFADWLYNRFVDNYRKSKFTEAFIFWDALLRYKSFAEDQRQLSDQRRHIKELYAKITKALKDGTADRLLLTGDEGIEEFNLAMEAYETQLREMGLSENYILERVSDKKMNYGNH